MDKHFLITVSDQKSSSFGVRFVSDFFSDKQAVKTTLFFSVPKAPAVFDTEKSLHTKKQQKAEEKKLLLKGRQIIEQARKLCLEKGFKKENIFEKIQEQVYSKISDILREGDGGNYDALVIGRRGLSFLEQTFEDSTSQTLLNEKVTFPLWLCRSSDPGRRNVLLYVDGSAASFRMADHVGFILGHEEHHRVNILASESILSQTSLMEKYISSLTHNGVVEERITTRRSESGNSAKNILKILEKESFAAVALGRSSSESSLLKRLFRGPTCSVLFKDLEKAALWLCP